MVCDKIWEMHAYGPLVKTNRRFRLFMQGILISNFEEKKKQKAKNFIILKAFESCLATSCNIEVWKYSCMSTGFHGSLEYQIGIIVSRSFPQLPRHQLDLV